MINYEVNRYMDNDCFYLQKVSVIIQFDMKFQKSSQSRHRSKNQTQQNQRQNIPNNNIAPQQTDMACVKNESIEVQLPQNKKKEENPYQQEILNFLLSANRNHFTAYNYFQHQTDITEHMRSVLLNWLIDVHLKYKLQPETLFITVYILDSFLERQVLHRTELQLLGITCLWIAAKYQETYQVPKISNLVFICDSAYSKEQILEMQSRIIECLNFDVLTTTSLNFFKSLNQLVGLKDKDYFLALYLLEICLFDIGFRKYGPKVIACSIIFFIRKLRRKEVCWNQALVELCAVTEDTLKPCARDICTVWQRVTEIDSMSSLRTKYSQSAFMEVGKIKIAGNCNRTANPQQQ